MAREETRPIEEDVLEQLVNRVADIANNPKKWKYTEKHYPDKNNKKDRSITRYSTRLGSFKVIFEDEFYSRYCLDGYGDGAFDWEPENERRFRVIDKAGRNVLSKNWSLTGLCYVNRRLNDLCDSIDENVQIYLDEIESERNDKKEKTKERIKRNQLKRLRQSLKKKE